jgi:hypothetical protein
MCDGDKRCTLFRRSVNDSALKVLSSLDLDKNPNSQEEATKKFKEISEAYEVLSDGKNLHELVNYSQKIL